MEECELCGKRTSDVYIVNVEDVELRVCTKCASGKKIVSKLVEQRKVPKTYTTERKNDYELLVDDYGTVIRNARERMKIPVKVLAELINEKETYLLHVEQQKTRPSEALRKKLERELGITLVDKSAASGDSSHGRGGGDGIVLGDFITKKK